MTNPRRLVANKLVGAFGVELPEAEAAVGKHRQQVDDFLKPNGPPAIIWFHQARKENPPHARELYISTLETETLTNKALVLLRSSASSAASSDVSLSTIELTEDAFSSAAALMTELYLPMIENGTGVSSEGAKEELSHAARNARIAIEALVASNNDYARSQPDASCIVELAHKTGSKGFNNKGEIDPLAASRARAAMDALVEEVEKGLALLDGFYNDPASIGGPLAQLKHFRHVLARLATLNSQCQEEYTKTIIEVSRANSPDTSENWKQLQGRMVQGMMEAQETVAFLEVLMVPCASLSKGDIIGMQHALPGIFRELKVAVAASHHFGQARNLAALLEGMAAELIQRSNHSLSEGGKLWDQDKRKLVQRLTEAANVFETFKAENQNLLSEVLKENQTITPECSITGRFLKMYVETVNRYNKLKKVFTAVQRFSDLGQRAARIEGVAVIIAKFNELANALRRQPYNLLEISSPTEFDRDVVEFLVLVNDLEVELQAALRASFSSAVSTKHAISLLAQYEPLLPKDVVESEMQEMYAAAFQRFGQDVDEVQRLYEKHKSEPPLPRGAPPVAGAILWSRSLLQRVEPLMQLFASRPGVLESKDAKKVIKAYNSTALALTEFEGLWQAAWIKSITAALLPLNSPLLVTHPETGELLVNLDQSIPHLIRETQWLGRIGLKIPEPARLLLLRSSYLQQQYDSLSKCLKDLKAANEIIPLELKPLMKVHLDNVARRAQPGLVLLTWTSSNIEGFIQQLKQASSRDCYSVQRVLEISIRVKDVLSNRIKSEVQAIASIPLLNLVPGATFEATEFAALQESHLKQQQEKLKNRIEEAMAIADSLVDIIITWPLENVDIEVPAPVKSNFLSHCWGLLEDAVLKSAKQTLDAFHSRFLSGGAIEDKNYRQNTKLGNSLSSTNGSDLPKSAQPLLSLELRLTVPQISVHPSLNDLQGICQKTAGNVVRTANDVLQSVAAQRGIQRSPGPLEYIQINSQDQNTLFNTCVSTLQTAISAMQPHITSHIAKFDEFSLLWKTDLQQTYQDFINTSPTLEDIEYQLQKLVKTEQSLEAVCQDFSIGAALRLNSKPIWHALHALASNWKAQFSSNLHDKALTDLQNIQLELQDLKARLSTDIDDLDSVSVLLSAIKDAQRLELTFESIVNPIEETYALLGRYNVAISREENDALGDLQYTYRSITRTAPQSMENLAAVQDRFQQQVHTEAVLLASDAAAFKLEWMTEGPSVPGLQPQEAARRLKAFEEKLKTYQQKWEAVSSGEALFGLPTTAIPELVTLWEESTALNQLYSVFIPVLEVTKNHSSLAWAEAVPLLEGLTNQVNEYQSQNKRLPKILRDKPAYKDCRLAIEELVTVLPLLSGLAQPGVHERHWLELASITGTTIPMPANGLTLGHLFATNMSKHKDSIEDLCAAVAKEEAVERKLKAVASQWRTEVLTFAEHKQRGPLILKPSETSELMERLEDSLMTLGSLSANRYSAPFRKELQEWTAKLGAISETMERWLAVQALWTYMEAVFSGGDIVRQLPAETKRFQAIDRTFVKAVIHARETLNCLQTCVESDIMRSCLPSLLEQLEMCQKSLAAYLESKRSEFPRFYFVSDPTLLEILSLGSDPPSVVPHFQSGLFDSLSNVTFDKNDKMLITEMWSREGECVPLETPVEARGNIEVWLQKLVAGMQDTMKSVIREAAYDVYEQDLEEFILTHPAQVALLGLQFQWTAETQAALFLASKDEKGALSKALKKTEGTLKRLVAMALRGDLTRVQRTALETCITVYMHQKEATEELVRKKVRDPQDFEWLKQCRFYWRDDRDTVIISICDVDFEYSYEYLGVKERLVITPLTDVCYVTLSQALGMYLGGAPAGPAGTGKTETTKDLGATLGKYVVVFNCSDQMDYKGMGKIYKGLAQSGLWGCFDEFNRINLDVLSVCAQQLHCVLTAIRERKKSFLFTDGTTVPLDPRVGFFITMNPGYAGRQELPENLKALFRGVTMMVPNRQIIMKVKLAAAGYQENDILSKKFFVLYALCEQQLSKQPHYDFGLRNILSVLRTAGASKRANPTESETELMMRTLRDMNMSKFVAEDVPLFLALLDDIFPGQNAVAAPEESVIEELKKVCEERGLQPHASWIDKCMQLYASALVRHGNMVVGPAGSGKSAAVDCLAAALSNLGQKTVVWRMNPKAITAPQMFGRMDAATGDWTDGVFSVLWRRAAKAPKGQNTWIVLDGPVDAVWIENLNTVLDDNKVLTLANGDRVLMTQQMRLIFEVENLSNASPATVSRAGIVYFSDMELGWQPVAESWLASRNEKEASVLRPCFERFIASTLDFVRLSCKPVMKTQPVCQVATLCTLLTGLLGVGSGTASRTALRGENGTNQNSAENAAQKSSGLSSAITMGASVSVAAGATAAAYADGMIQLERQFLFALVWSLGGLLSVGDRGKLDAQLRQLTEHLPVVEGGDHHKDTTVYDYVVNEQTGLWQHWEERLPEWNYPQQGTNGARPKFNQMIVPTLDSVRYEYLLGLVHKTGASLLVGGPGTAKTTIIQQFLSRFDRDAHTAKTVTFSYLTTPLIFQNAVEASMEKRQGRTYGPPGGKSMTMFLDDLSMPKLNNWGDQITNELVRQLLDQGGFYSLDKPIGDMKNFVDTRYIAAMGIPGSGRPDIPNRLKRQFCIFYVPTPSTSSINNVFGTLMSGHFGAESYSPKVQVTAQALVHASMDVWTSIQSKMMPTPTKFHYLFNLRDLSRVFQGVMMANITDAASNTAVSPDIYLLCLWKHECLRVFCDKLITPEDKAWVANRVQEAIQQHFGDATAAAVIASNVNYFVNFMKDAPIDEATGEAKGPRPNKYTSGPTSGLNALRSRVQDVLTQTPDQTKGGSKADLVLFGDALEHLLRISRVLNMERGSVLLVGVGGSGKQSLIKMAARIAGYYCFQITLTKSYGVPNLLEDLKGLYKHAALKPQPVCFLFTDSDVKDDAFLEYINQLLMTGEIGGLFPKDELDVLLNDIRPVMKLESPGTMDTWDNLYSFCINRVRDKLHVALCFSPVGPKFSRWAQQFPGLINGCTIDWFLPWPEEALLAVSTKSLGDCSDLASATSKVTTSLQKLMAAVHTAVTNGCREYYLQYRRSAHVTPKSYISSIEGFKQLYSKKLAQLTAMVTAISNGLQKLNEAKDAVELMKIELAKKTKELEKAAKEAEKLLAEISEKTAAAEKERAKVGVIVEAVRKKAAEIARVKAEAEGDLAAAKPALQAAVEALNSIQPKDIQSLKALKNPPDVVKRIFDCVLLLRHFPINRVSWQDIKGAKVIIGSYDEAVKMMGDMAFLQALVNFPKEAINDETVELLQPYFAAPDFNFESAKKASGSVAGLCNWAEAMCQYHNVAKVVEPKIVKLRESEEELRVANKERQAAEEELAVVQAKLDEMQQRFDAAIANKKALEDDAADTQRKMTNAAALIAALGGEEARWVQQKSSLQDSLTALVGDCALASSFLSYLGPFNRAFRDMLLSSLREECTRLGVTTSPDLHITTFLANDVEVGQWAVEGLPTDNLSIQNGILVTRATRCPFLVDPQGQGRSWLLRHAPNLTLTQLTNKHFRTHLEECLNAGKPLLIENVDEELDPLLDPVLERRFIRKGKSVLVQLGDKEIDVGDGFALYITTRLPNPKLSPELSAKVTVIDFTVTATGLEDQLLARLVLKEKRELEEQRRKLVEEVQSYKSKVEQLEADLLLRLSSSTGNLLDDTQLIDVLAMTKQTAQEVAQKLQYASETRRKITEVCEEYRPAAARATLLYFLIADFAQVNCMYQTSLAQFTELYEHSIDTAQKSEVASQRASHIAEHLTASTYNYIQTGLFERHKLVFALMLANRILLLQGGITKEELDAFLKQGAALGPTAVLRKKPKDWIPATTWRSLHALAELIPSAFGDLVDNIIKEDIAWRQWYDNETPEAAPIPGYKQGQITKFQRMCLIRAFREDRTLIAASDYIASTLGARFVESIPASMESVFETSKPCCPAVCLLSPGADPTKLIEELAKRRKIKCTGISMGQGQEIVARRHMATATAEGHWVLLQNAHLGLGYLAEVEQWLARAEGIHEGFRLWITTEPHPSFPIGLLQMSIKATNEAPVGMRAGLRASMQWVTQDLVDAVTRPEWKKLLFTVCYMHSVVQERRKFGPIGWNVPYEFNSSDLSACVQFLQNHVQEMQAKKAAQPDWSTVRYMISTIQYGGRITDELDRKLMDTFAERYFHPGILQPHFELFCDPRTKSRYLIPDAPDIDTIRANIEELPLQDHPELFGLHSNADIIFRTIQVQEAAQIIEDSQPRGGGGEGGASRDDAIGQVCQELLSKVPLAFDAETVKEGLKQLQGGPTSPLNIHLRQEIDRLNKVLATVVDTLKNLRLAIAGTIALSDDVLSNLEAVDSGKAPKSWLKISWEAPSLTVWFQGLLQRHDQLYKWLTTGRPKSFWLTGFFNPQGFLTAVKQEVTRRHAGDKWALDDVVLVSEVTKCADPSTLREAPGEGVFIHGLYLEGAGWALKQGCLVQSEPKKLYCPLPVMHVSAVLAKDKKKTGYFEAPCYKVKKRTGLNYVSNFMLSTTEESFNWVLRGVALLCSID